MKNYLIFILFVILSQGAVPPGCDEVVKQIPSSVSSGLTNQDIVEGLKTALLVGTDSSVKFTSKIDGFYKDAAIKIMLPPEAKRIYDNRNNSLLRVAGFDQKIEEAILALNRAAEDAASEAGPIFKNAIKNLTIAEGLTILGGKNPLTTESTSGFDSTAATSYLYSTTYSDLNRAFSPKINVSLNKVLVGNLSPNQIWNTLTHNYNTIANNSFGLLEPVQNTDLGNYVTEKALDGLFYKVGQEERKIRQDPWRWAKTSVGNILQKVFGTAQK